MDRHIKIEEDGSVVLLDNDGITDMFRGEGKIQMSRASHIDWSEVRQEWDVLTSDRKSVLFSHKYRQECLKWEQENLQP